MKKSKIITLISVITVLISSLILSACGEAKIKELVINSKDFQTTYVVNESIDYSKLSLTAVYEDESKKDLNLSSEGVTYTPVDTSTVGTKTLTVNYEGKSANLSITVEEISVVSIEVVEGLKNKYWAGEDFNAQEVKLKITKEDESVSYVYLNDSSVNYVVDLTTAGEKTLTVTYGGKTTTSTIIVEENTVLSLEIVEGLKNKYLLDDEINAEEIKIKVSMADESVEYVYLSDNGVVYDVDMTTAGEKTLTVTYKGKTITTKVNVVLSPSTFALPQSYIYYQDQSDELDTPKEKDFAIKGNSYVVGSINKFKFVPQVNYFDWNKLQTVTIDNPITTVKLFVKKDNVFAVVDNIENYISEIKDNMYKFNSNAEGKEFRLEVSLDESKYDISWWTDNNAYPTIKATFKVVKAYNAYDTLGLSVVDNLNVKHWAEIKNQTLVYDDKKLSEYTDVKLVVLHNNIAIDADLLPENYFWSEDKFGYKTALASAKAADASTGNTINFAGRLNGSLRNGMNGDTYSHCGAEHGGDTGSWRYTTWQQNTLDDNGQPRKDYAEEWGCENVQKGIFNTNQCSISGNYMTISVKDSATRHFTQVLGQNYGDGGKAITNPYSAWSIFKFYKNYYTNEGPAINITIDNLFMLGNMPKVNESNLEAGLMAINSFIDTLTLNNVVSSQFYTHIVADGSVERGLCTINFENSRMFDAYSNMFYLWRSKVNIVNTIMENAGGPLFLLVDGTRLANEKPAEGDDSNIPVLKIDDKSKLESYAAGTEAWYSMNNATLLVNMLKSNLNNAIKTITQKSYVNVVNGVEQINLIAVMIPVPGEIMKTPDDANNPVEIYGKVIRNAGLDNEEVFDINDTVLKMIKGIGSAGFVSGGQYAFMADSSNAALGAGLGMIPSPYGGMLFPGAEATPSNFAISSDWISVTMSADASKKMPYFSAIIGDFKPIA